MFGEKRILAIIPARGGSKGIPRKNIISLCGEPLISYTIKEALCSRYIDYVMVSTEDEEIASVSRKYGANIPFMRPREMSSDQSKTIDAIMYSLNELEKTNKVFDILVILQPTSPLRTVNDIDGAIRFFFDNDCNSLMSVSEVENNPLLIRSITGNKAIPLMNRNSTCRRQDMEKFYVVNGAIYINEIAYINSCTSFNDNDTPYVIDRSHAVDIDEFKDIVLAEYFLGSIVI